MANVYSPIPITPGHDGSGMRRISSRATTFNKKVFPIIWFGFLVCFVLITLRSGRVNLMFFVVPAFMGVFGYFIMKKFLLDLVDEVWDSGNSLLVKNGAQQEMIPLSEIINVNYTILQTPNRVTLTLRQPSGFGKEISFLPPTRLFPFSKHPVVEDLIQRIDHSRRA